MQQASTILVPITNTQASLDAVTTACTVARPRRAQVVALHVIEVLRALPLNTPMEQEARRGEQILRRAEEVAAVADYHITGALVQAREAGQAIVDEARDRNADIIILGIGYKRLVGEFQVGRTADYILRHAQCQVWVVRQSLTQPGGEPEARR